jgi:hypothetical protein
MGGTVVRLRAEVRDPWGVRTAITSHPFVTAGVVAGVGVVGVRLLMSRKDGRAGAPTRAERWAGRLLDGGFSVLLPIAKRWAVSTLTGIATPTERAERRASDNAGSDDAAAAARGPT